MDNMSDNTRPTDAGEPAETQVPGRAIEVLPEGIRRLRNGTLYDEKHSRFVSGPTTSMIPKGDSAAGRAMAQRRNEIAAAKARAKMVEAYQQHTGRPGGRPTDAYGELAGEFTRSALANAMDKPRDAVPAAKFALQLARMLPAEERPGSVTAVQVNVTGGDRLAAVESRWADSGDEPADGGFSAGG